MKQAVREADTAGTLGTTLHQLFQRSLRGGQGSAHLHRDRLRTPSAWPPPRCAWPRSCSKTCATTKVLFVGAGEMIELVATHFAARTAQGAWRWPTARWSAAKSSPAASAPRRMRLADLPDAAGTSSTSSSPAPPARCPSSAWARSSVRSRRASTARCSWSTWPCRATSSPKSPACPTSTSTPSTTCRRWCRPPARSARPPWQQAEAIIETGVQSFVHWLDQRAAVPLIQALHTRRPTTGAPPRSPAPASCWRRAKTSTPCSKHCRAASRRRCCTARWPSCTRPTVNSVLSWRTPCRRLFLRGNPRDPADDKR